MVKIDNKEWKVSEALLHFRVKADGVLTDSTGKTFLKVEGEVGPLGEFLDNVLWVEEK